MGPAQTTVAKASLGEEVRAGEVRAGAVRTTVDNDAETNSESEAATNQFAAPEDDAHVAAEVKAELADEPLLQSSSQVSVASRAGEVVLRGQVPSEAARLRAVELARAAPGVAAVVDRLEVTTVITPP